MSTRSSTSSKTAEKAIALLQKRLPAYVEAVEQAKAENQELSLSLDTFEAGADLLFMALWYAYEQGLTIRFLPRSAGARQ